MQHGLASEADGPAAAIDRRSEIIARLERVPFSRFHLHLASILAVGTFFDAFDALTIAVALTVVFTSLHIGFMNAGLLISAAYVGQFVGAWFFGYLSEFYGRKTAFIISLSLFDAAYACYALPESVRWLADRGRHAQAEKILATMEAQRRRVPLPPLVVRRQPDVRTMRLAELFSGIYLRRTIVVWVQSSAAFFVAYGYNTWLPTLYVRIGGLPVTDALLLSIVSWVVTLTAMYAQAYLLETIGRKPLFIIGFAVVAVGGLGGALAVILFHAAGWPVLFGTALALGLGTALNSSAALSYTAELYPTRMRGLGVASGSSMNRLASILSPTAVGTLLSANFGIESVFAMFGAVGLIGFVVLATMGIETKHRTLEELSP